MRSLPGVDLPYLYGAYGRDLAPSPRHPEWGCAFHLLRAYRPLLEARALGLEAVRIFLCEGAEGIVLDRPATDDGARVTGIHPQLLESIRLLEEGARVAGVRIYWSLLDATSIARDGDPITRAILGEAEQTARFAAHVAAPIARALDPEVAIALEIVGGAERAAARPGALSWEALGRAIALAGDAVRAERPALWVTAGVPADALAALFRSGARVSAIDLRAASGGRSLPAADGLARIADDPRAADLPRIAVCTLPADADRVSSARALGETLACADAGGYAALFFSPLEGALIDARDAARPRTPLATTLRDVLAAHASASATGAAPARGVP